MTISPLHGSSHGVDRRGDAAPLTSRLTLAGPASDAGEAHDLPESDDLHAQRDAMGAPAVVAFAVRFVVRDNDRARIIKVTDVDWLEASRNYVVLHTQQKTYRVRATLQNVLKRLDPGLFVRIHKSTVVNLDRIREIQPWFGGDHVALLHDGQQLRVSRTYARQLLRPIQ